MISVNGAAAHKANPGDRVIICSYGNVDEEEMQQYKPILLYMDEHNIIEEIKDSIPAQAA